MVAPLTGDYAAYGDEIRRGVDLALDSDELKNGGERIVVSYEDACLPAQAVAAAKKMVEVDSIQAVVGSYCVIGMVPMVPILERASVIAFHTSPVTAELARSSKYLFTTNVLISDEGRWLANYARKELKARTAAVFFITTQWGQEYADSFASEFVAAGGATVLKVESSNWSGDYRSELTKIKKDNPDLLFIVHIGGGFGSVAQQARRLGIKARIVGPDEAQDSGTLAIGQDSVEGAVFASPVGREGSGTESSTTTTEQRFSGLFRERYGVVPGTLSANAYDATIMTVQALRECKLDSECARNKLSTVQDFDGASGKYSMSWGSGTDKRFIARQVRGGEFVAVK